MVGESWANILPLVDYDGSSAWSSVADTQVRDILEKSSEMTDGEWRKLLRGSGMGNKVVRLVEDEGEGPGLGINHARLRVT